MLRPLIRSARGCTVVATQSRHASLSVAPVLPVVNPSAEGTPQTSSTTDDTALYSVTVASAGLGPRTIGSRSLAGALLSVGPLVVKSYCQLDG